MLLPALNKARQRARTISCVNNMKQLGTTVVLYSEDNGGNMPPPLDTAGVRWRTRFIPYLENRPMTDMSDANFRFQFQCQTALSADSSVDPKSYSYVQVDLPQNTSIGYALQQVTSAAEKAMYAESRIYPNPARFGNYVSITAAARSTHYPEARHDDRSNILFVDGHVTTSSHTYLMPGGGGVYWPAYPAGTWRFN